MLHSRYSLPAVTLRTSVVEGIEARIDLARRLRPPQPIQIIGRAGTGKSTALRMIAQERGFYYTEAEFGTKSANRLYEAILHDATPEDQRPSATSHKILKTQRMLSRPHTWFEDVEGVWEPKVLIVDEIQQVELTTIRQLLQTAERAQALLILAGNERGLASGRGRPKEDLEPITSRLCIRVNIETCTVRDCEMIASAYGVEGMRAFRACATYGTGQNLRELVSLLEISRGLTLANSIPIAAIEEAAIVKHGRKTASKLLENR